MSRSVIAVSDLLVRTRSVNRKYVDVLQQRIENLEALNQRNHILDNGSAGKSNESGVGNSANPSDTSYNVRYVSRD